MLQNKPLTNSAVVELLLHVTGIRNLCYADTPNSQHALQENKNLTE